jgi:hypothetical protein
VLTAAKRAGTYRVLALETSPLHPEGGERMASAAADKKKKKKKKSAMKKK